jgi:cell division FtsZ-interacting protein ZapD
MKPAISILNSRRPYQNIVADTNCIFNEKGNIFLNLESLFNQLKMGQNQETEIRRSAILIHYSLERLISDLGDI